MILVGFTHYPFLVSVSQHGVLTLWPWSLQNHLLAAGVFTLGSNYALRGICNFPILRPGLNPRGRADRQAGIETGHGLLSSGKARRNFQEGEGKGGRTHRVKRPYLAGKHSITT